MTDNNSYMASPLHADAGIRVLDTNHAAAMARLEKTCFTLPWTEEQCRQALGQKYFSAFGIFRGNDLIAYISCFHAGDEMEIVNLAVEPGERRKGLGSRILAILLQAGAKMGMQKAVLEVREGNLAAIALYAKNGFKKTGMRPGYYCDNGENALILSCNLNSENTAGQKREGTCKK